MAKTKQMKQEFSSRDISSTFVKGMTVLRAFDDNHTRLTLAEIAQLTELDRATVRRLTLTLVHLGYALKKGRHFSLSPKVLTLAGSFLRGNQFGTVIQPILNRYSAQLGTTVSLAIIDGTSAVYVAQSTLQDSDVSFGFTVGSQLPLLHTAIGRSMLAAGDQDWTDHLIGALAFEQYTPETIMQRDAIARRVDECRQQGFAIVCCEFEAMVTGVAVSVGGPDYLKATVGISLPTPSVPDECARMPAILQLQSAARELARTRIFSSA